MTRLPNAMRFVAVASAAALIFVASPASAEGGTTMRRDHNDNRYTFTYDSAESKITWEDSYHPIDANDPDKVDYFVYVRRAPQSSRKPLFGEVDLKLITANTKKPVTYRGAFTFKVRDLDNGLVVDQSKTRRFTLTKDHRNRTLRFYFDLPSGDYSVTSSFRRS